MTGQRIEVAIEGLPTVDGRFIEPGSLRFMPGFVPVMRPGGDGAIVGLATLFRRDERGHISCEVRMSDGGPVPPDLNTHIFVSEVDTERVNGRVRVKGGLVRGLYLSGDPWGWPRG